MFYRLAHLLAEEKGIDARDVEVVDGAAQLRRDLVARLRQLTPRLVDRRLRPRFYGESRRKPRALARGGCQPRPQREDREFRSRRERLLVVLFAVAFVVSSVRILRRDIPPPEVLLGTRARVAAISPGARRPETADLVGHHIRRFGK